tara:strand:+ start:3999 stop:4313 length:315 start_codon:yes stop_codon:yes gene_type:complete
MISNFDVIIHIISLFLVIFFTIIYCITIILNPKIHFIIKLLTLIVLIAAINISTNILIYNMDRYITYFCNNSLEKFNDKTDKDIIFPFNYYTNDSFDILANESL